MNLSASKFGQAYTRDGDRKLYKKRGSLLSASYQGQKSRTPLYQVKLNYNGVLLNFTRDVLMNGGWVQLKFTGSRSCILRRESIPFLLFRAAKSFGHRIKTTHCVVFMLRSTPVLCLHQKQKAPARGAFAFGGGEGSRTPVRKSLDTAFSECSPSFEIPLIGRRRTAFRLG